MKKILILCIPALLFSCSSDEKINDKERSEEQVLEDQRDMTQKEIDSLKKEIEDLRSKRDSIKSISPDSVEVN